MLRLCGTTPFINRSSPFSVHDHIKRRFATFIDPEEYRRVTLVNKELINYNTKAFTFSLPRNHKLGTQVGQHIYLRAKINGTLVIKPYTPISSPEKTDNFTLAVKVYPDGSMTQHLDKMVKGDDIEIKGPKGTFIYEHDSDVKQQFVMIAGGSGITPMLQIIRCVMNNPKDDTEIRLIFANVEEQDIVFKSELDSYAANNSSQFGVYYVLEKPPNDWKGGVGYVSLDMIKNQLQELEDLERVSKEKEGKISVRRVLRCGRRPMNEMILKYLEQDLGISKEGYHKF